MKYFILKKETKSCIPVILLMLLCSCTPLSGYRELINSDMHPPIILGAETISENCFILEFSEVIIPVQNSIRFLPPIDIERITISEIGEYGEQKESLCIYTETSIPPGTRCIIEGEVKDPAGNTLFFSAAVYGWNDSIHI
ncbi:MAG: hypothetical protein H8D65_00255, partial [Spirochaetes bacterium]|nr:hypothetical protein [Spirochaetota bacterium]